MQIYYINLARRTDRRAFMEAQFEKLGLEGTRVEAVTPGEVSADIREEFCNPARDRFLSVTDLCCSLSHVRACEALLSSSATHALVLEDDVVLSSGLPDFLAGFDQSPPLGGVVRIETSLRGVRTRRVEQTIAGVAIVRSLSWEAGAAGYVIDRGAAATLVASRALRVETTDEAILHPYGPHRARYRVLQTIPGLCIQTHLVHSAGTINLGSDLNTAPRPSHTDQSRLARTRRQLSLLFHREIIMGGKQTFHQLLGAKKRVIPFLP